VLTTKNTVAFRGEITPFSVSAAMQQFSELNKGRTAASPPLYLVLDTPGGEIEAGNAFVNYVKTIPNVHTITIFSASMGSAVVEALPGTRYIVEDGIIMFHRARTQVSGTIEVGDIESRVADAKHQILAMEKVNAKRIGLSIDAYKDLVRNEWWIEGSEAVSQHAVDQVVTIACTQSLIDSHTTMTSAGLFETSSTTYSKCPLFRYPLTKE
jgi:ATP-dependent protease ClpP protease subunit